MYEEAYKFFSGTGGDSALSTYFALRVRVGPVTTHHSPVQSESVVQRTGTGQTGTRPKIQINIFLLDN